MINGNSMRCFEVSKSFQLGTPYSLINVSRGSNYDTELTFNLVHLKGAGQFIEN
jgi:hypothetical protein